MPTTQQVTYHCEKCGKTVKAPAEGQAPSCCGAAMKKQSS